MHGWPSIHAVDRVARATKNAASGVRVAAAGVECSFVATLPEDAPLYPNVDVYVQIPAVAVQAATFAGATVRLYSLSEGVQALQATGTIAAPVAGQGVKAVSVRSRGAIDRWIATIQFTVVAGFPTVPVEGSIVTFDGAGDDAALGGGTRSIPASLVAAATGVISASPAMLYKFFGHANDAMPGPPPQRYLQLFDKAAVPVLGDVPRLAGIPIGPGATAFALGLDPQGLLFTIGIAFGVSTTIDTFTAPGAGVNTVKVSAEIG